MQTAITWLRFAFHMVNLRICWSIQNAYMFIISRLIDLNTNTTIQIYNQTHVMNHISKSYKITWKDHIKLEKIVLWCWAKKLRFSKFTQLNSIQNHLFFHINTLNFTRLFSKNQTLNLFFFCFLQRVIGLLIGI